MRFLSPLVLLLVSCGGEEPPAPDELLARQAIREAIEEYHEAGDKGDVDGMLRFLTPDASMRGGDAFVQGRDECETELEARVDSYSGEKRKTIVGKPDIYIQGDFAVATYEASVGSVRAPISVTLRRTPEKLWRIWHISELWSEPKEH